MSNYISPAIRQKVAGRANNVCEYCLIGEADSYFRHQVEHIISLKHGGLSDFDIAPRRTMLFTEIDLDDEGTLLLELKTAVAVGRGSR